MVRQRILYINFDVQSIIVSFLHKDDIYCYTEVCKTFLKTIKTIKKFKNLPPCLSYKKYYYPCVSYIVKSINLILWAKTHKSFKLTYDSINFVARNGDLDILRFLLNNYSEEFKNKTDDINPQVFFEAAQNGFIHIIKWLYKNNYTPNYMAIAGAVEYGDLKMVKWMVEHDFPINCHAVNFAAYNNNVIVLKYLLEEVNCELTDTLYNCAAENGSLKVLKYLFNYAVNDLSIPIWDSSTIVSAAEYGHLNIIKYLRKKLCPWDNSVTNFAAINSNCDLQKKKTLKWCIDHGCPVDENLFNSLKDLGLNNYTRDMVNIQ